MNSGVYSFRILSIWLVLAILGAWAALNLPVQLFPDITPPQVWVKTHWPGANAQSLESRVVELQERALSDLDEVRRIVSTMSPGVATLEIELNDSVDPYVGTALISSRLSSISEIPIDVREPVVSVGPNGDAGDGRKVLTWVYATSSKHNAETLSAFRDIIERRVRSRLEAVPGVAHTTLISGLEPNIEITVDPNKLAAQKAGLQDVIDAAASVEPLGVGHVDIGTQRFLLTGGYSETLEEFRNLVILDYDESPIKLADVATVRRDTYPRSHFTSFAGQTSIAIRVDRTLGANTLGTLVALKTEIDDINRSLNDSGVQLNLTYDASVYIESALSSVLISIVIATLSVIVFVGYIYRSWQVALITGVTLPLTIGTTCLGLSLAGMSINTFTLAGLAFSIGLVIDTAIVVYDLTLRNNNRVDPIIIKTVVASTITTIVVFLPIMFLDSATANLFKDLAITIAMAISISALVSLTVIPVLCRTFKTEARFAQRDYVFVKTVTMFWRKPGVAVSVCLVLILGSLFLLPEIQSFPEVKQPAINAILVSSPGYSIDTLAADFAKPVTEDMLSRRTPFAADTLNFSSLIWNTNGAYFMFRPKPGTQIQEYEHQISDYFKDRSLGAQVITQRANLFGAFGESTSLDVHLLFSKRENLADIVSQFRAHLSEAIPGSAVISLPNENQRQSSIHARPNTDRLKEYGVSNSTVRDLTYMFGIGRRVGSFFDGRENLDVLVKFPDWREPQELLNMPWINADQQQLRIDDIISIERRYVRRDLRRVDGIPALTMQVYFPADLPMSRGLQIIEQAIEDLDADEVEGHLFTGRAESFAKSSGASNLSLIGLVLLVVFFVFNLFPSVREGLGILSVAIPIALSGLAGIIIPTHLFDFTPDMLSVFGFVVTIGILLNNGILLTTAYLTHEGTSVQRAQEAVKRRVRPLSITTLTTVVGTLSLWVVPGISSEMYQGMVVVLCIGIVIGTASSLVLVPASCIVLERMLKTYRSV